MGKEDIIDYVMETPGNTNKRVLGRLIDDTIAEKGVADTLLSSATAEDAGKALGIDSNGDPGLIEVSGSSGEIPELFIYENPQDQEPIPVDTINRIFEDLPITVMVTRTLAEDQGYKHLVLTLTDHLNSTDTQNNDYLSYTAIFGNFSHTSTIYVYVLRLSKDDLVNFDIVYYTLSNIENGTVTYHPMVSSEFVYDSDSNTYIPD